MGRKKQGTLEFRYYDLPQKERVLAMLGKDWIRPYGAGIKYQHFHNLMEIGYCRYGDGILSLDARNLPYEANMVSIIPKNYPHTTNSEAGTESYWEYIFLDPEELLREIYPENEFYQKKLAEIISREPRFFHAEENPQLAGLVKGIMEEMRIKKEYYIEAVHGMLNAILYEIARINGGEEEQTVSEVRRSGLNSIAEALSYISVNYAEPIRIEMLADLCHMSETHFRRLFTEYMKMTPVEYINMVRIQMACEFMKRSNASMSNIAVKCGFTTPSTFNRNFKQLLGITPYQWKKNPENYESRLLEFHISATKGW